MAIRGKFLDTRGDDYMLRMGLSSQSGFSIWQSKISLRSILSRRDFMSIMTDSVLAAVMGYLANLFTVMPNLFVLYLKLSLTMGLAASYGLDESITAMQRLNILSSLVGLNNRSLFWFLSIISLLN